MATGFMMAIRAVKRMGHSTLALLLCLCSLGALAQDVGLAGLMGSKALLMLNGGQPQAMVVGQSMGDVRLVAIQNEQAVVEINGKRRTLRVGQHAVATPSNDDVAKIILTANGQGHFFSTGTINGVSVRFLVDTGATMISLGRSDAQRIGLDASKGERGISNTANGQVEVRKVKLDMVRLGDITLHNVDALIHQNEMPIALLGMSFLNRMEMQRDGSTMTLKKRF
jgi:aspartyl protease family protein